MAAAQGSNPGAARFLAVCGILAIIALEPRLPSATPPAHGSPLPDRGGPIERCRRCRQGHPGAAIKDSYHGLKALIQKRLAADPVAAVVLQEHEKEPETCDAPLRKKLAEAALEQDEEILEAARQVLEQATPSVGAAPAIDQTISNVKYAATSGSGDARIGPIHDQAWPPDRDG